MTIEQANQYFAALPEGFAPAALVEDIRSKRAKSQDKLANIEQSIQALG